MIRLALFTLVFLAAVATPAHAQEVLVLARGGSWRYLDGGQTPTSWDWLRADFNESSWKVGQAPLGYGDGGATATDLSEGAGSGKALSYYFRTTVSVSQPGQFSYFLFRLRRDDGAVIYLNGEETFRSNMPPGPITPTTLASNIVGSADESVYIDIPVSASLFREGSNQLAVQVHQRDATSSDIHFDLEVAGIRGFDTVPLTSKAEGWYSNYPSAVGASRISRVPLMLYFYRSSDPASLRMNRETLGRQTVDTVLNQNFVRFQFDVDRLSNPASLANFQLDQFPTTIFMDGAGKEIGRIRGYHSETDFQRQLYATDLIPK